MNTQHIGPAGILIRPISTHLHLGEVEHGELKLRCQRHTIEIRDRRKPTTYNDISTSKGRKITHFSENLPAPNGSWTPVVHLTLGSVDRGNKQKIAYPANTRRSPSVELMLGRRLRRRPNINSTLDERLVSGLLVYYPLRYRVPLPTLRCGAPPPFGPAPNGTQGLPVLRLPQTEVVVPGVDEDINLSPSFHTWQFVC